MMKIIHGILLLICFCSCEMKSRLNETLSLLGPVLKNVLCAFLILVLAAFVSAAPPYPPPPPNLSPPTVFFCFCASLCRYDETLMHLWNADASLRWECEGLRLPEHGRILKRPSLGSCVPLFALKQGLAAATHHAPLADGVPAGCGRVFAFSSALLFSKAGSGRKEGGMRLALIVLTDSPQGSTHQLSSASSLHINTSFRSLFFLWIITKSSVVCLCRGRKGWGQENPKQALARLLFWQLVRVRWHRFGKGFFSGSSHSLGQATSDGWKRLCHFTFGATEGKVGQCCVRLKVLKAANMKTFWERDANCVVESCPLWTHPTVITVIGARTGPRGLSNKETIGSTSEKKPSKGGQVRGGSGNPAVCLRGLFDYQIYRGGDRGPGPSAMFKETTSCAEE